MGGARQGPRMSQLTHKNHFAPVFYQRRWARPADGKVCQYSRPFKDVIVKWVGPEATGFEYDIYTVPKGDGISTDVEDKFFKKVDQDAHNVLAKMLGSSGSVGLIHDERCAWARFIMSMGQRHPVNLKQLGEQAKANAIGNAASLQADWEKLWKPGFPLSYHEAVAMLGAELWDNIGAHAMPKVSDMKKVGDVLINMQWNIVTLTDVAEESFLTSDRPVILSNGLAKPEAHVVMPISPRAMFVAAKSEEVLQGVDAMLQNGYGITRLNEMVIAQAGRFVYDNSDQRVDFVRSFFPAV
jgi:hypothetical protein